MDRDEQLFNIWSINGGSIVMAKENLKLFMLKHEQGGVPIVDERGNVIYYSNKMVAKRQRKGTQVVSYGIDHRRYKLIEGRR